jgi:hypothetical protein
MNDISQATSLAHHICSLLDSLGYFLPRKCKSRSNSADLRAVLDLHWSHLWRQRNVSTSSSSLWRLGLACGPRLLANLTCACTIARIAVCFKMLTFLQRSKNSSKVLSGHFVCFIHNSNVLDKSSMTTCSAVYSKMLNVTWLQRSVNTSKVLSGHLFCSIHNSNVLINQAWQLVPQFVARC